MGHCDFLDDGGYQGKLVSYYIPWVVHNTYSKQSTLMYRLTDFMTRFRLCSYGLLSNRWRVTTTDIPRHCRRTGVGFHDSLCTGNTRNNITQTFHTVTSVCNCMGRWFLLLVVTITSSIRLNHCHDISQSTHACQSQHVQLARSVIPQGQQQPLWLWLEAWFWHASHNYLCSRRSNTNPTSGSS